MTVAKPMEKCPLCREPIRVGATRCKHCHADLSSRPAKKPVFSKYNNFRFGFTCGVFFTLVLFLLAYFQFFAKNG